LTVSTTSDPLRSSTRFADPASPGAGALSTTLRHRSLSRSRRRGADAGAPALQPARQHARPRPGLSPPTAAPPIEERAPHARTVRRAPEYH
jgi:hypothetical protein